jgi:hypothetical protein
VDGVCFGLIRMNGLKKAIQKRQAWEQLGENGQAFVNEVKKRFGISRIKIITQDGHYDSARYVREPSEIEKNILANRAVTKGNQATGKKGRGY